MGYLGKSQTEVQTTIITRDPFVGTGTEVNFTLTAIPPNEQSIVVTIDGVTQHNSAYNFLGNVLTFTSAPANLAAIEVRTFSNAAQGGVPALNSITNNHLAPETIDRSKFQKINLGNSPRQTVLTGGVNSTGQANFVTAGTGLATTLNTADGPVVTSFAYGYDDQGAADYIGRHTTPQNNYWTGLPANNTSYLAIDRNITTGALTSSHTLNPPQYGTYFDKTKQALLHFESADTSTSMIDDYGNTWSAAGNAQIDTAQFKFGTSSLLLDGTGDYISTSNISSLNNEGGGWTLEGWFRWNDMTSNQGVMATMSVGNYGFVLKKNNAATGTLALYLSGTGLSWDIANNVSGAKTNWATGIWYHIAVSYDPTGGYYRVYIDGTQDIVVGTTLGKVCGIAAAYIGFDATYYHNGWVDEFQFSPYCKYPNGTTFTPAVAASTVSGNFFSTSAMTMYSVTSASTSAGTNPTMTAVQKVYVGEAVTGAATVSSTVTYALKGKYVGVAVGTLPIGSTYTSQNHNLGVVPSESKVIFRCRTTDYGFVQGDRCNIFSTQQAASSTTCDAPLTSTRLTIGLSTSSIAGAWMAIPKAGGATINPTNANWEYIMMADRGW